MNMVHEDTPCTLLPEAFRQQDAVTVLRHTKNVPLS